MAWAVTSAAGRPIMGILAGVTRPATVMDLLTDTRLLWQRPLRRPLFMFSGRTLSTCSLSPKLRITGTIAAARKVIIPMLKIALGAGCKWCRNKKI